MDGISTGDLGGGWNLWKRIRPHLNGIRSSGYTFD